MNAKFKPLPALLFALATITLISLPSRADVGNVPATGTYTNLPSSVNTQNPATNIPMLAAVTIPFQEQFSFTTDSGGRTNRAWYVDNYYLYLQHKSSDDVGYPKAGILFKASRAGMPETIANARIRLVLARPLSPDAIPLLRFYRVKHSFPWSSKSFPREECRDPAGNCYNAPAEIIDFSDPLDVTGEIRQEEGLNGRSILYADISRGFSEHSFSLSDGIFMELQNNIGGHGHFNVATFYGKNAPSPALVASLIYFYDPQNSNLSDDLAANTCGDGICDPMETCAGDCEVSSDLEPPGLSLTISPEQYQMDTGTHITATARRTGEIENNSNQGNSSFRPVINAPVYDSTALVNIPNLGSGINPDLFDLTKPVPSLSIWVAGFSSSPWNRLLRGTEEDICTYESSPAPGIYKLCARARDDAGNVSETLCRDFRIGSGTPPNISVSISPEGVRLGETLKIHVSVSEHHEGLSSVTVNFPGFNPPPFEISGENWNRDFELPLCDWTADVAGKLNPIQIGVTAVDGESMSSLYSKTISPEFPLQARYGLGVANFGAHLCWDQYAATFGNDIYASVSVCAGIPIPGKCWNNAVCTCYSGTPGSGIANIVDALGGWIMEAIIEAIDTHGRLNDYFCVDDLSDLGVPDLFALLFFPAYSYSGVPGQCTGFTTAAAMLANQAATPDQICPGCGSKISSWSEDDISFYVGHRQGSVVSAEFIHLLLANYTDSADTVIHKLYHELLAGKHPGISIFGYPDASSDSCSPTGHTLLVDRVRNRGNGIYRVYVYDSNRPLASGDAETTEMGVTYQKYCNREHSPYIDVDTQRNNFTFQLNDPADDEPPTIWSRGNGQCNIHLDFGKLGDLNINADTLGTALLHIPFSQLRRDTFTLPLSIEGMITMFIGNATVSVEDGAGHSMGTDGNQHNGIPGAYLFPLPGAQNSESNLALIMIPGDQSFTVHAVGKTDQGHFINILSDTGTNAVVLARPEMHESFSVIPQANGLKISLGAEPFNGALHLLARKEIPVTDIAGNVNEEIKNEKAVYTRVYSFIGTLGQQPASFMIEKAGTLSTIASQAQACKLFALSNENDAGDNRQAPLSTMFKVAGKQITIPAGVHHLTFDLQHRNTAPFLLQPISRLNAAPTEMAAYSLANPAAAPAATIPLVGSKKTNVALVPKLQIPAAMQGKTGNFYAVLYWVEGNAWFQFTPAGLETIAGGLKPFRTATSTRTADFNLLQNGVDLSDFRGTLDIFTGFATENDLSDLVYNYYQVIFE